MTEPEWTTRPVRRGDREAWSRLFAGYCRFYGQPVTDELLARVWGWIHDDRTVEAIVAVPASGEGEPAGLAHLRSWFRPLRGEIAGYLDDLFVDPERRGSGVVEALFAAIEATARAQGWSIVRWTTADDNYRARSVYDRYAARTGWITYELAVPPGPRGD